mgnify:FL=1|jgi:hypothetical protein|tara:strand:+ start:60 stop:293 length:234 start_codon:yes stop_codon:yes gene_type:complete
MIKLSDEDQLIVDDYFDYSVLELEEGIPRYVLEDVLDHYKDLEDYLPCAGIKKALDWYDKNNYETNKYTDYDKEELQ